MPAGPTAVATAVATAVPALPRLEPPQTATAQETILALGTVTFESGPLPPPLEHDPRLAGFHAGYVCVVIGIVRTYFEIEDCRPAAIRGATFYDDANPVASVIEARYPAPAISFWAAHGWKLIAWGVALVVFASIVWRLRAGAVRRRARERRQTRFQLSAIDPAMANHHLAAWEPRPIAAHAPAAAISAPSAASHPAGQVAYVAAGSYHSSFAMPGLQAPGVPAVPAIHPAQPPGLAPHRYGPYGRVTAHPHPIAAPCDAVTVRFPPVEASPAPPLAGPPGTPSRARFAPASADVPTPLERPGGSSHADEAAVEDASRTMRDLNYQAYVETEHAHQLARGSQPDELERTRRQLALPPIPAIPRNLPAVRAIQLRHPPVPRPPRLSMLAHMPKRLSWSQ
ncbi:MAG TPA: hypothetical protein VFT22_44980 [Kofleriaceae bacterium]|nr:hypothetical protein [Kofleriaceae bacterium]